MRSSESPLASLPCPDSVGHPSLPLLLLDLNDNNNGKNLKPPSKLQLALRVKEERKTRKYLCVELVLFFVFSVPHAGGCRKLGLIL